MSESLVTRPRQAPPASFRLSPSARRLLGEIAQYHGLRNGPALEVIIREAARTRGIMAPVAVVEGA